tara:strand:- start:17995 stop:18768 length:774 start_codon:yes stop_codon:yes gene_type:complete
LKALIGIGDSWTQGEGGYTDEVWKANNGRMWKKLSESMHLIPMEQENSWVNRLAQNLDYASINLGQRAIGNRGAVRSLYLNDVSQYTSGTVVLILTGFERFDLFNEHWQDDHYKFHTLWPFLDHKDIHKLYQKVYSEKAAAVETACCILEAQNYAKANNFDFIFGNGFEIRGQEYLNRMCPEVSNKIDWNKCIHTHTDYDCFARLFARKDNVCADDYESIAKFYPAMLYPATYMTNDMHPTIEGYKLIAAEIKRIFF